MAPASPTPRRPPTARRRGRPPGSTNAARAARQAALGLDPATEPPPKRRRYIGGGAGGGGRYLDRDFMDAPNTVGGSSVSRSRAAAREALNGASPSLMPRRRERNTRARAAADELEEMNWGSAAAMVASVKQAEDYKPREERSWEEFHPNLDIERIFMVLDADEVDGVSQERPGTPAAQTAGAPANGSMTPSRHVNPASTGNTPNPQTRSESNPFDTSNGTPSRRSRRPTRDVVSFYSSRPMDMATTPKTPKILPIYNQTPKERLDLKQPSYRKTNRIELFESKTFGQARYVDKAMSNVGYQESDNFSRSEHDLIKALDGNMEEELDYLESSDEEDHTHHPHHDRVEYDMDEQDDMWLEQYNATRKQNELEIITREVFEITMTKIEKEWHALEKRIPKPNPKPPQTHRPRSSSAAAVSGEPQAGEEPDSKCAICDDGDCENTNAIVFCDGCNLAVHQECYGVPFIPEGQWLCRRCQLCGRGSPSCIFCPNSDGAFKQTNSSKWAHLLCAMWIPEVSLGNHTFMEPVMDVEKVPKTRWKLTCYICKQRMGACIQCGNKNCYQAFHVTCARRSRLFLKMKTSQGQLAVLDGSMVLKAFCDKHCPPDYTKENEVYQATRAAKRYYKTNMPRKFWADNLTMANAIAAQQRHAIAEHPSDESQMMGAKNSAVLGGDKKTGQLPRNVWKLPSGAPIIPQAVFEVVEAAIQRFPFRKRKDFLAEACRYWTLKREARRGAALLKRLQLQMESFSSMELTRRNFASMGPSGEDRLARRVHFGGNIVNDVRLVRTIVGGVIQREEVKTDFVELERDFVDECYFPTARLFGPAIERAMTHDKNAFMDGLEKISDRVDERYYVTGLSLAKDLCGMISNNINNYKESAHVNESRPGLAGASPSKDMLQEARERKRLAKRILKGVQPYLETALRVESEIANLSYESLQKELEGIIDEGVEADRPGTATSRGKQNGEMEDTIMVDAPNTSQITVKNGLEGEETVADDGEAMDTTADGQEGDNIEVHTSNMKHKEAEESKDPLTNGLKTSDTPPDTDGYISIPRPVQSGPPTPPQSNGSLGQEAMDPLSYGGILWYMKTFEPQGTSVISEHWAEGRDALRMLSEELTDLDEEEFKGLGVDVDNGVSAAIMGEDEVVDTAASAKSKVSRAKKRRASGRRR